MSFLPLDDLDLTLTDVLAFLDDFDSDQSSLTSSSSSKYPVSSPTTPSDALSKRKKSRAAASRRFQQKKKAELLALRVQVTELKKRLKELQENGVENGVKKALDETQKRNLGSMSLGKAELEKHLRLVAEAQNRQLKTVLLKQQKAAKVVRHLLQDVTAVVHMEEGLRTPHPAAAGFGNFVPSLDDAIYGELASRMGKMYLDADRVFKALNTVQTRFITDMVEVQRDVRTGIPYVELRATLPVQLTVKETSDVARSAKPYDHSRYKKYVVTELGLKKESEIELQDQSMAMSINMMSLARMYDEKDRVLSMWTSLVCDHPLNSSVRFREQAWIMATASPLNPQNSVLQLCYRLSPDLQPGSVYTQSNHDADAMAIFVLQKLGAVMRRRFLDMGAVYSSSGRSGEATNCQ